MFRGPTKRHDQYLPREKAEALLQSASSGVLSLCGDGGYPYGVPVNFAYDNGKIYIHSSAAGHKLDAIARSEKVCFTAICKDTIVEEAYTSYFASVIAFGTAKVITDDTGRRHGLARLIEKYCPHMPAGKNAEMAHCPNALIIEVTVEHMTAKVAKELVQ